MATDCSANKFFATAPKGVASLLADELRAFGAIEVKESPAGAYFEGSLETAYRACLWSRTANRILLPIAGFDAASPDALYAGVSAIDWQEHLVSSGTLAVDFSSSLSRIEHTHFGALKVKDAIVDQFRARCGERPSVRLERPDLRINVYLHRNRATVSIDLSGDSLHRRGYRASPVLAPLKENLAAAILLRAGWPQVAADGGALVDPMCGSATLPIEAALIAGDCAPALGREYFGFNGWLGHQPALWQRLRQEAGERRHLGLARVPPIAGFDDDRSAVRAALDNVAGAGLQSHVHIERRALGEMAPLGDRAGLLIVNPPYGVRLGDDASLAPLYQELGSVLRQQFVGWKAALFTGNPDLAKTLGIRARRTHKLYNGAIECRLLHFDVDARWFMHSLRPGVPRPAAPEDIGPGASMLANRLRKNLRQLERWAQREGVSCYRVYDADLPEYAFAVDLYQGDQRWLHVQEYQAPASVDAAKAKSRVREAMAVIPDALGVPRENMFFKVRRRQKGAEQYSKHADEQEFVQVDETDLRFLVNFSDYLDTGLFLDQRPTRQLIRDSVNGRSFLNLFAYTGTASVYAAAGGARATHTIDMSKTYLAWAERNMALNGFDGPEHRFIQADCLEWLERQAKAGRRLYDVVFLDPPTFSASKRMQQSFDVQRDHVKLIQWAMALLTPRGVLIFSNNYRKFKLDAEALSGLVIDDITAKTIAKDFQRNTRIHNCWRLSRT